MSNVKCAAQVIAISNDNCLMCLLSMSGSHEEFINVWGSSAQSCSDGFMTLFGSFERIRAMTQGEWKLLDDIYCM